MYKIGWMNEGEDDFLDMFVYPLSLDRYGVTIPMRVADKESVMEALAPEGADELEVVVPEEDAGRLLLEAARKARDPESQRLLREAWLL